MGNWAAQSKQTIIRIETKPSEIDQEGYPSSLISTVDIPARGELPPVKLHVYTKEKPDRELLLGFRRGTWGDLLVGSKGSIYSENPWNTTFVLLPKDKFLSVKAGPPETLPVSIGHHREWVEACKGNGKTFSSFDIGGPLTELIQVVNASTLVEGPIEYDTLSDQYARFLLEEILPEVGKKYKLTDDPDGRAICGISSGGICAWTVASV